MNGSGNLYNIFIYGSARAFWNHHKVISFRYDELYYAHADGLKYGKRVNPVKFMWSLIHLF